MSGAPPTAELRRRLLAEAAALGFDHCRIAPMGGAPHGTFFGLWLDAGRAGDMRYLTRVPERRRLPELHSPTRAGAEPFRSVVVLGAHYSDPNAVLPESAALENPAHGRIAAYAWGRDYHEPLRQRLYALDAALRSWSGRTTLGKALVDTGPVLERDWAARSGIGFFGKNCCTIHPTMGSWLFLATLLVPEELEYDAPPAEVDAPEPAPAEVLAGLPADGNYGRWEMRLEDGQQKARTATCGKCTRCLDACPTAAFVGPYHLDPQRCISYWTIETQAPIPRELRAAFGNRIFGCDVCQVVCPWNQRLPATRPVDSHFRPEPGWVAPPLLEGFGPNHFYWLHDDEFERHFRDSPIVRATRAGMLRNVCVALGNWNSPLAISALALALGDEHAAPRGHAAWALGRMRTLSGDVAADLASATAADLLRDRLAVEENEWVREEIHVALA